MHSVRARYAVLAVVATALLVARWDVTGDWAFFVGARQEMLGADGLGVYLRDPRIQIGPLALVAGLPLTLLPGDGGIVAKVVVFALGLACVRMAELLAVALRGTVEPARALLGGLLFLPLWAFVATSGHLDDALAVAGILAAMLAVTRDRETACGLLLGLAVAAKPWALTAVAIVWGLRRGRRTRALLAAAAVVAVSWAPFVIAEPGTVRALADFRFGVVTTSGPALLFGLEGGEPYPAWLRPVQLGAAIMAAWAVAWRGGWWAVPAVAFGLRVVLEPGITPYHAAGLGAGALVVDLLTAGVLPILGLAVAVAATLPTYLFLALLRMDRLTEALQFNSRAAVLRVAASAAVVLIAASRGLSPARGPHPDRESPTDAPVPRPRQEPQVDRGSPAPSTLEQ